jgi:anti-sigma-K factor RskA/putative zinc finger protein
MRPRRPEPHTLAGAYAMDAADGADKARFERHLASCPACFHELAELREATARLAGAVATEPPANLVKRVVASASQTPQLPQVPPGPAPRWRPLRPRQPRSGTRRLPGAPRQSLRAGLALALAAALLAVAAASSVTALTASHQLGTAELRDHLIAQVLTAPDAVMLTARAKPRGTATIVMSHRYRSLVLTTTGLPPIPAGHRYQLWLMGPSGDRSAGLVPAPQDGMTSPVIATGLAAGDRIVLTVAPQGGSPHPASTPILMLNLTAGAGEPVDVLAADPDILLDGYFLEPAIVVRDVEAAQFTISAAVTRSPSAQPGHLPEWPNHPGGTRRPQPAD